MGKMHTQKTLTEQFDETNAKRIVLNGKEIVQFIKIEVIKYTDFVLEWKKGLSKGILSSFFRFFER